MKQYMYFILAWVWLLYNIGIINMNIVVRVIVIGIKLGNR